MVGYGKSSCDVAQAVCDEAASTRVVVRQLIWKVPKMLMNVLNYKYLLLTRMAAHETLAAARRERAAAIDPIDVAASDESQCVAELHATDMDTAAAAKSKLATGAQALFEAATRTHADAVHTLNTLRERTTDANALDDAEGSVRTHGTTATPRSMSSLSTTPTVAMTTAMVTRGFIIPRNDFRRAASLLHHETNAAIREIVTITADEDVPRKITDLTTPMIDRRAAVISALKTLLDNGIVTPMRVFHARVVDNAQDRRITKATVEPQLEHAAARIAAVVEAERPANRPTLKGLIHDDVDKKTEELHRRIQSLEAKLGETKNALKRKTATSGDTAMPKRKKAKNERGDATKSNKTPGTAVAPSAVIPNKKRRGRGQQRRRQQLRPRRTPRLPPLATTTLPPPPAKSQGRKLLVASPVGKGEGSQSLHATSVRGRVESWVALRVSPEPSSFDPQNCTRSHGQHIPGVLFFESNEHRLP